MHSLSGDQARRCTNEYHQRARLPNMDPYKLAMYKIIGHCELEQKSLPQVATSSQDFLWLQLVLLHEPSSSQAMYGQGALMTDRDRYTLEDMQALLLSHGPANFGDDYFIVLLLSAQFERVGVLADEDRSILTLTFADIYN